MPGRPLREEALLRAAGYARPEHIRRRAVLRETLARFEAEGPAIAAAAEANHRRWAASAEPRPERAVAVFAGDWGEVTGELSRRFGQTFAVLNMANAYTPGGAYIEGTAAQEENLFRRTDCHFAVADEHLATPDRYRPEISELLEGRRGRVYLDTSRPRHCIRGAEDRSRPDLGYPWLPDDRVFRFYELRAAAVDLRDGSSFDRAEMARRIEAQLDTLVDAGLRWAVLSAFGCGAFRNPAPAVAELYRDALSARRGCFDLVAFAVFHAGYGPDNHAPFAAVLGR